MEEFLSDGTKPVSNEVIPTDKTPKKESNPFKLEMNKKEGEYIAPETSRFVSPLTPKEREKVGSYYLSQDPFKILSKQQSTFEQLANMGGHIVTNFIGDTIESVGSTIQIGSDILNEAKNKDAEFKNDIMTFGEGIKQWGKENLKTYRENPNDTWDVTDPAWWTDGIESSFSSLSFLVGGLGAVKGVGALAKLTKAEQLLAKVGANVEKLKLGTKIGTSAAFARNAENMMESYQVRQNVKNNLLKEWEQDPNKFEEAAKGEIGAELAGENREVNQENLANFIAGKAGWKTYGINSLNIVFDALQMAPLFKGFNPATRIGKFGTSSRVLEANNKLFNSAAKGASKLDKVFDILNPTISGIGRSASEGIEEAINYIGTEEGMNLADQLTNKDDSSFTNRMSKYLKSGDLYESAFWGTVGGALFQGATPALKKGFDLAKGIKSNSETDLRIMEINNRANILKEGSEKIKKVTEDENLDDNSKKAIINNIKSELSLDLGLRAAQHGNVNLLLDQINSKEYKDRLIDSGIAHEEDVDKVVAKTEEDIILAEKIYKKHYNSFQTAEGSELAKNSLMNQNIITDFYIQKNEQRKNDLSSELNDLKVNDQFIKNSDNKNLESLLYLHSLKIAKKSIEEYTKNAKTKEDELLSVKGLAELEKISNKISQLEEQTKDDKLDLKELNPDILSKQAEIILMEGVNNIQAAKTVENRKPETIKKEEAKIKQQEEEFSQEVFNDFKNTVDERIKNNTINSEEIDKLIKDSSKDKKKKDYLKKVQKEVLDKEKATKRKTEVEEVLNNPVKESTSVDEFGDIPQFEIDKNFDDNKVDRSWKAGIDNFIDTRDIDNLKALVVGNKNLEEINPVEVEYTKQRIQRIRNEKNKISDIQQLNTSLPQNDKYEFEFNEDNQENNSEKRTTLNDLDKNIIDEKPDESKGYEFLSKAATQGSIRTFLPIFGIGLEGYGLKDFFNVSKGNIKVKSQYEELIKTLMNPEFTEGAEVSIVWDKNNKITEYREKNDVGNWKGNINNEAFKIVYKGVDISYLPTEAYTLKEIALHKELYKKTGEEWHNALVTKLQLELPYTLALRKQLELSDKEFKTKLLLKGNGTVISRGLNKNDLRSVKGKYEEFFALDPESYLDKTKLLNISNPKESFSGVSQLRPGVIYGKQIDANGNPFPVPLFVSKVNLIQAKEIQSNIEELLNLLNSGKNTENEEVIKLKDNISKYIKVDRSNNFDKEVGFRVFSQGKNKEGEITEPKIEMTYFNSKGTKLKAVMRLSQSGSGSYVGIFDGEKKIHQTNLSDPQFLDILQRKYQNIDFSLLTHNKPFSYNGKDYSSYKEYLIEEEVIKTDIADVQDSKGNFITNLFGNNNDFTIAISPVLKKDNVDKKADIEKRRQEELFNTLGDKESFEKIKDLINTPITEEVAQTIYERFNKGKDVVNLVFENGSITSDGKGIFVIYNEGKDGYNNPFRLSIANKKMSYQGGRKEMSTPTSLGLAIIPKNYQGDNVDTSTRKSSQTKFKEINAKYDAELAALEKDNNTNTTFKSKTYEPEMKGDKTKTDDLSYRENYSIYKGNTVSAKDMLTEILKNAQNDNIKQVATFLQSNISKINLQISLAKLSSDDLATYSTDSNLIKVNNNNQFSEAFLQQTVLHEMYHGLTVNTLLDSMRLSQEGFDKLTKLDILDVTSIPFKNNAEEYVKNFMVDIVKLRNDCISQLTKKYGKTLKELHSHTETFYGLENPFEFISEAMTNPNFRNELRELDKGSNLLTDLYNKIVDFINNLFGVNLNKIENDNLKTAVNLIKNFIDKTDSIGFYTKDLQVVNSSKSLDKFENNFTRTEINETINTFEGIILNILRNKKLDTNNNFEEVKSDRKIYDLVKDKFTNHLDTAPETTKDKLQKVSNHFTEFYDEAFKRINKNFKISTSFDLDRIQDNQEVTKDWNDKAAQQVSSQDSITNQIKMFIKTIPDLNSTDVTFDKDGNPLWDRKKSTMTGLSIYVDFNIVYPYMIRNLIGARSMSDVLNKLKTMSKVHPSFAYIASELERDSNLLAQFESNLAKKHIYDSYVTFITNIDGQKKIWTSNELKATKYDYVIADAWAIKVNKIIDEIKTPQDKVEFNKKINTINLRIAQKSKNFKKNIEGLTKDIYDLSNTLGVDLSLSTIQGRLENLRNWEDFEVYKILGNITKSIEKGKQSDNFGNLNTLAKLESLVRYDVVENSGLDIKGNLIYAIRNPNFISNWFMDAKSDTKEGRQAFEERLLNMSKIPDLQFSNWLWSKYEDVKDDKGNTKTINTEKGFIKYEIKDAKKVPLNTDAIDWDFVKNFNFHNFGGAKETISKNTQDYTDFSDKDWQMLNLINYIKPDDNTARTKDKDREFVLVSSLIPSDSGTMYMFEAPKIKLGSNDLTKVTNSKGTVISAKINPTSKIYNAILNINRQEIRRIQQATKEIFDIIDNKLVVKQDLDVSKLQQYYHFGKELVYDKEDKIDLNKSLLNDNGTPKGKAFKFSSMLIEENGKVITLNDVDGVMLNGHLGLGEISTDVVNKIKQFTETFINQQINYGLVDYKSLEMEVAEKHSNISDGTFENLVAEFVLNTFIHNAEQFNFFNGNITEYKDKIDTNKRAKQMFAPGIGLSLENMKIKYENGNYSDGVSFKGITLKDIKTNSKTIDFITKSVRERLLIEQPNLSKEELEKSVNDITSPYKNINSGDAQGYITLDRYEQILRGLGRFDEAMSNIFDKARKGKTLNIAEIQSLQPLKGFYYGREYDANLNKLTSNQIKYSSMPLIPQLVKGTELEKLMKHLNDNNIEEAFFESAHKVGAKQIFKIDNEDGTINEEALKSSKAYTYYNKNWQLQLDVPEHLLDEENLLATQIAKIIIANLDSNTSYNVNGKSYKSDNLIKHYFDILETNIVESANNLIKDLGIEKTENGFIVKDRDIQRLLSEEVEKRGLSDNYSYAIELTSNGDFRLPLFVNSMATKWEAILTSIFTNRIIKQKVPGGSAVLGSRLFLDNKTTQSESSIEGIQWSKDKLEDKTLKSYRNENGTQVVEVLLSSWSSELFNKEQRISIDDVPDEVKTMIGYRIPTQAKHSMIVFKVVGFLPEQNRGLIITPDDLVAQMGSDFDIDKLFLMNKNFYTNDEGKFIVPNIHNEKKEYEAITKEIKFLYSELYSAEAYDRDFASTNLVNSIFGEYTELSIEDDKKDIRNSLTKAKNRLREMMVLGEDNNYKLRDEASKQARQNEIFDIYHSILTNPVHFKEIFTPAEFEDFKSLKTEIEKIFNENDNAINPLTDRGQRKFRKRNIAGRSLKGIAANLNAFGSVAQVSKMKLNDKIAFKFRFDLDKYDQNTLIDRYDADIEIGTDNFATITFKNLGYSPDGSYLNVDGKLILEHASQGIGAAVDIAKDPTFDAFNATTYTYPLFHTMLLTGIPTRLAGMFIRQPILKALNDYYFESKSLLGDTSGNEIESIKRFYQTELYLELLKQEKIKPDEKTQKVLDRRNKDKIGRTYDKKYLVYIERGDTEKVLQYNPDNLDIFDVEQLKGQLLLNAKTFNNMKADEKLSYLKTQLQVLEYFNNWKKAGEGVQDILQATKTDSIGAGPTMDTTSNLIRSINRLEDNERVLIDDKPAITKLYPSHFNLDEESAYKPLENYLNYGNKLSIDILSNLFINQSQSFKDIIYTINSLTKKNLQEEELKYVNKFLNVSVLQDFNYFQTVNKEEVLGINKDFVDNVDITFNEFKSLSTANKVYIMKQKQKEYLKENSQNVLNFLTPLLDVAKIKENGYHKIDFIFYKNEFTDDNLADSITKMYYTGDDFEKNLAEDLIKYSYVTNGLTFGFQSFAKVIPNEVLYDLGLGEYLKDKQKLLSTTSAFNYKTIDTFFKNNWNNSQIVPTVRTKWDYLSAETIKLINDNLKKGVSKLEIAKYFNISEESINKVAKGHTKVIRTDRDNNKRTKDNSPLWDSESNILIISEKSLKTLKSSNNNVVNSPYLNIPTKDGSVLFKKYIKTEIVEEKETNTSTFNGNIYYYKVNKLGKDGINEFSDKSMFEENNTTNIENVAISNIENIINKIEEQRLLNLKNTSKEEQEKIKKDCGYGK